MRPLTKVWLAWGSLAFVLFAVPAAEKALMPTASCFAFVGMVPKFQDAALISRNRQNREALMARHGLATPKAPHVFVTRYLNAGEPDFIMATRTSSGWQVVDAGKAIEVYVGYVSPGPAPRPLPAGMSKRLDALMSKKCLFNEPAFVSASPRVWPGLPPKELGYWDGEGRSVEVNDGSRSHISVQNAFCGINGAISELIVQGARGSYAPKPRCLP